MLVGKSWVSVSGLAMAVACASPGWAQGTAPVGDPPSAEPTPTGNASDPQQPLTPTDELPDEIVVTAQKRTERLQDVPVAVSVISGAAIAAQGGVNIEGAQYLVPTLTFRKSGTSVNQSLYLRGVGTSTFSIGGEPSVSTVLDGVVYSRAGEAFGDLVDIERIEVLRGPQGTLFGKNASAGVVNIISRRPGREFGGYAEASYFDRNEYRARVAIDVPFGPSVRSRLVGFYSDYDGNIRNETLGRFVNGYQRYGVRGIIVADASEDVQFTLIGDYRQAKDDCCGEVIGTTPTNFAATILPEARGDRTRRLRQNLVTRTEEESYGVSLQGDATFGDQTITSITAYRNYSNTEIRDGDFVDQAYVGIPQLHDSGPQTGETFSQEIRLTSPGRQFFDYVLGGFYSRAQSDRTFTRDDIVCTARTPSPTAVIPCGSPAANPSTFPTGTATFGSVFQNLALFGQGTVNISEAFRLIAGLRYTVDRLNVFHSRITRLTGPGIQPNFDQGVFDANGNAAASNGIPFRTRVKNDNLSGKAGAQFDLSDDSTAYATYSRGYKGPAFNVFFNLTVTGTGVIEPESADSYEIGLKNAFFGGRLVLNLAAYYAKYRNYQANNPDLLLIGGVPTVVTRFTNAGDISTRGAELDVLWRPLADLSIGGGLAYTDAKVDRFRLPPGGNPAQIIPDGTPLAYAPKLKASLSADYRIRTAGAVDVVLGAQGSYQSRQLSLFDANLAARNASFIDGYALLNVSAGIVSADERYRLLFQVKNVFDQSFAAAIGSGGPGASFRYLIPREADRYVGVTGRVAFGAD